MVTLPDLGFAAARIFSNPELIGKDAYVCSDQKTIQECADSFSKILGAQCVYNEVDDETHRNFGYPGCKEMANMEAYYRIDAKNYCESFDLEANKKANPNLVSLEKWIHLNKE